MSVMAAAVIGSAVIGGVISQQNSKKADARADKAQAMQESIAGRQLEMADEAYKRYLELYGPLEEQLVNDSKDYGSEANKTKAAQEAAGTVASSYAGLRDRLRSTPGLDPTSDRYLKATAKLGITEAAQSAAAQTGARRAVESEGRNRLTGAVGLGKGLPQQASSNLAAAGGMYASMERNALGQAAEAGRQGAAVGRMLGDLATDPRVLNGVRGWFSSTPDINVTDSSATRSNEFDLTGYQERTAPQP